MSSWLLCMYLQLICLPGHVRTLCCPSTSQMLLLEPTCCVFVWLATSIRNVNCRNTRLLRITSGSLGNKVTEKKHVAIVGFIMCWCSRKIIRAVISGRKFIQHVQQA